MGGIVKGVTAAFTQGKKNREAKAADKAFKKDLSAVKNFQFGNAFEGIKQGGFDAAQIGQTQKADVAQLGPAAQAEAQGYESQGYDAQGYEAERAEAAQAAKTQLGEDTGFTNQFQDLQVNTAAADRQAQESDAALAASQDLAAQAGSGAGGATALAAAALKSKQGVADTIAGQEAQNQQLRAQGATDIQRANLAQRNTARQANIQQDQFNTGLDQQTRLANQQAANQAAQFGASAQNQAAQFGATAANQAAQFGAAAQNQANLANTAAQNQFAQAQFNAQNQANNAFAGAANNAAAQQAQLNQQAAQFGASAQNQAAVLQAQGAQQQEQNRYGALNTSLGLSNQQNQQAQAAKQQGISDIAGGVGGILGAAFSDERLKENITKIGESPSGINIYQYNYIDSDIIYEGVIAQEVPQASIEDESGFLKVDYSKIDVELKIVE